MKLARPDLAAYALAALGILCLTVLLALGRAVPDYFPLIVMTVIGAGGGLALNTPNGSETVSGGTVRASSPAPAQRTAAVPAQRPAPAPATAGAQA